MTPIIILGIAPRSGTNYIYNLILNHPDCTPSNHYGEDFLLSASDKLICYADIVTKKWSANWNNNKENLFNELKEALMRYIRPVDTSYKAFITKTPFTHGLDHFYKIFPDAKLIIITRNPQDLSESYVKSGFTDSYESIFNLYARGADEIIRFRKEHKDKEGKQFAIVKYEDLMGNTTEVLTDLFRLCELDPGKYDFKEAIELPVFGSSSVRDENKELTWKPIEKNEEFKPVGKKISWDQKTLHRFHWKLNALSAQLGYNYATPGGFYYKFYNTYSDMPTHLRMLRHKVRLAISGFF